MVLSRAARGGARAPAGVGLVLLLLALASRPQPLLAHDGLRSATPGDGDTLAAVPEALRLVFTRAQNLDLASVTLVGPGGTLALGDLSAHPDSAATVLVPVRGAWASGEHVVRWRIVGADGHPVSGEYGFVVAETAAGLTPPVEAAGEEEGAPARELAAGPAPEPRFGVGSPLYVAVRWAGFMGLLGVLGSASWALLVVPLARRGEGEGREPAPSSLPEAASVGIVSALVVLGAGAARLWAQGRALAGGTPGDAGLLGAVLSSTAWGAGWWLQMAAGVLAAAGFAWARRRRARLPWALAGSAAVALAFTPALSGHAVGVEPLTGLAVLADGFHVLAAGGWMGGLVLLLAVGVPAVRSGRGRRHLVPLVEAFSLTALGFATVLVVTGVFSAWLHLGAVDALWSSGYGRTLGLKLALLVVLFAAGAWNWLRVRPAVAAGEAPLDRIRRSGTVELAVAVAVVLVTAVLVATPPPADSAPGLAGSPSPVSEVPLP